MNSRLFFFFTLVILFLPSCLNGKEKALEKDNTIVFYNQDEDEAIAKQVLNFWIKNKFNGKRKQHLKIVRADDNKSYLLKIIKRDYFKSKKTTFEDLKLLNDIQRQLNKQVFLDKPCQIAICDHYFKIITIPNKLSP